MPGVDYAAPGETEYDETNAEEEEKHPAVVDNGEFVEEGGGFDYCDCTVFFFSFMWLGFNQLVSQEDKDSNVAGQCDWDLDNEAPAP